MRFDLILFVGCLSTMFVPGCWSAACTDTPDKQVGIKRYYFDDVMSTFTNAEQVCVAWNMDLATFENSNEFNAIFELQFDGSFGNGNKLWTGLQNPETRSCTNGGCSNDLEWHGTGDTIGSTVAGLFSSLTGDGSKQHMMLESGNNAAGSDGGDTANVVCMCYEDHHRQIGCETYQMTFSCAAGETIEFKYANYGRTSKLESHCLYGINEWAHTKCFGATSDGNIRSLCEGQQVCDIMVTHTNLNNGNDPCGGIYKYAKVIYKCNGDEMSAPANQGQKKSCSDCCRSSTYIGIMVLLLYRLLSPLLC